MANRAQLYRYRGNRCAHCGMPVDEMVARYGTFSRMFEFHHVDPAEKHPEYAKLMDRTISSEQIEEVDKCVLLCRECHGIVHAQDLEGAVTIQMKIGTRLVSQRLEGWFVSDRKEGTLKFLSHDRNLLHSCLVQLGSEVQSEYCVLELMQENRLLNWLREIETYKQIQVRSVEGNYLLLEIEHEAGRRVNVRMALGFPLLAMDLEVTEGGCTYLWLRNGIALTTAGEVLSEGEVEFSMVLDI